MFRAGIKWIWMLKGRIIVTKLLLEQQLEDQLEGSIKDWCRERRERLCIFFFFFFFRVKK